jgi:hypothetical protein
MTDTTPQTQPAKPLHAGLKCPIVFLAAIVGSVIVHSLEGKSHSDLTIYSAEILGGATAYFGIAMIFAAFIRGSSGAITGVTVLPFRVQFARNQQTGPKIPKNSAE